MGYTTDSDAAALMQVRMTTRRIVRRALDGLRSWLDAEEKMSPPPRLIQTTAGCWQRMSWTGAASWGHLLNYNYVAMNMTATIAWSPLWSV